jgi:rhodanese-related sulfurtransferase
MSYETLDPAAARARLEGDAWIYLDVRTVEEYEPGHVPGAYNVPIGFRGAQGLEPNPEFVALVQRHFTADTRLVVGCAAGIRSARACELLSNAGFTRLANMDGGFSGRSGPDGALIVEGWASRGFPTTAAPVDGRTFAELSK